MSLNFICDYLILSSILAIELGVTLVSPKHNSEILNRIHWHTMKLLWTAPNLHTQMWPQSHEGSVFREFVISPPGRLRHLFLSEPWTCFIPQWSQNAETVSKSISPTPYLKFRRGRIFLQHLLVMIMIWWCVSGIEQYFITSWINLYPIWDT